MGAQAQWEPTRVAPRPKQTDTQDAETPGAAQRCPCRLPGAAARPARQEAGPWEGRLGPPDSGAGRGGCGKPGVLPRHARRASNGTRCCPSHAGTCHVWGLSRGQRLRVCAAGGPESVLGTRSSLHQPRAAAGEPLCTHTLTFPEPRSAPPWSVPQGACHGAIPRSAGQQPLQTAHRPPPRGAAAVKQR